MKFAFAKSACLTLAAISLGQAGLFAGCGIDWSLPKFHFDSVNEWGYLSYWDEIGKVQMGEQQIPIHIHYLSNRNSSSPYLGHGWSLPLLESRMVQVNENEFKMWQPEGRFRTFGRDSKNPNLLNGQGGWKAEIRGDIIHAYANCGWKLSFRNGRILSMGTPDGRRFRYDYQNGLVSGIREDGTTNHVLKVIRNEKAGGVTELRLGNQTIALELGEKPLIEQLNSENLIGGIHQSLTKITRADGKENQISYDVDPDNIVPTFQPSPERRMTTRAGSGFMASDGNWKYQIQPDTKHLWNNAAISRTNNRQEKEFWHVDQIIGREIVKYANGTETVKNSFVSGSLRGKNRDFKLRTGNEELLVFKSVYSENGNLKRRVLGHNVVPILYNDGARGFWVSGREIKY